MTRIVGGNSPACPLSALDVGCGPGLVTEMLRPHFESIGVDMDEVMVRTCREKGIDAACALAENLPFENRSFDVVYCSWLLLWVRNPTKVVTEMKRVSNGWVCCLAEPDYGARIDQPEELASLGSILKDGIKKNGGDPLIGRKLRGVFNSCGLTPEIGVHPGVWSIERLREETENEWESIKMTAGDGTNPETLDGLRSVWDKALADGTLLQFNPVFYALARIPQKPDLGWPTYSAEPRRSVTRVHPSSHG